jgi:hypothetical protein
MSTLLAYAVAWVLGIGVALGLARLLRDRRPHATRAMRRAVVFGAGGTLVLTAVAVLAALALAAGNAGADGAERRAISVAGGGTMVVPLVGTAAWVLAAYWMAGTRRDG